MNTTLRTGGFVLGLAAVTGAGALIGAAVGPVGATEQQHDGGHGRHPGETRHDPSGTDGEQADPLGLTSSAGGYTLQLLDDQFEPDPAAELHFQIVDSTGGAVTAYEVSHGKELHLIAVSRDLSSFQHVHPVRSAAGVWSTSLGLGTPGDYRVFADFTPDGAADGYTLGHDVSVVGARAPLPLPEPSATTIVDGYEVALDGALVPGRTSRLTLSVRRDGEEVTDLEPYLGAYGHLVALRDGDLAYLHVHPDGEPGDGRTLPGPSITFHAEVPSAGRYRLFLDFQHQGTVRTAAFTAVATEATAGGGDDGAPENPSTDDAPHGTDGHDH